MSSRWAWRRLATGLFAFVLSPVLAAVLGLPTAQGANPPAPSVSFDMASTQPLIGETVAFDVSFVNGPTAGVGYGPYVDIELPMGADSNDGLTFTGATYLGAPVTATQLTADIFGCVLHPYAVQVSGDPVQICGLANGQSYVVLRLPFGSFTPGQPAAAVHVTTQLSDQANVDVALPIVATGGFQFGADPLDNPATDPSVVGTPATTAVTPKIMRVSKSYNGPEDETATGPNYPRSYTLRVTVAPGQTVTDLTVSDTLPDTIQYVSTNTPTSPVSTLTEPSTTIPGGTLSADFGTLLGTGGTDATLTFNFYVPRLAVGGAAVLPAATGAFVTSIDSVSASGTWDPLDALDPTITATAGPATHSLTDKSIAIQKSVAKVGAGAVAAGDTLEWTISVQVSDYFALDTVVVDDLLGDGTRFDAGFAPVLAVAGNGFSLGAAGIDVANYTVGAVDSGTGKTPMSFRLSSELVTRGQNGRMVGGCIDPAAGSATPDCAVHDDGATTATIVYRSIVQQTYVDGTTQVVEGDTLTNLAAVTGVVLDTGTFASTGNTIGDGTAGVGVAGTGAQVTIERGSLQKSIYAVNGDTDFTAPVHVSPGDSLTYRLRQTFPTSRTIDFKIIDYLPLPVFYAAGVATWDGTFDTTAPATGHYKYGPADSFHLNAGAPAPAATADAGSNSIEFAYGDYALYPPAASTTDILFTVTVSTDPFADGLLLTNQARSETRNAVGTLQTADAIVQITLDQPVLAISKGVAGTDNPAGVLAPATPGPVNFVAPAAPPSVACPGFNTGLVTTAGLASDPVGSDLSGVDAGDYVRFAVVVENSGHADAFEVQVADTIPAGFAVPAGGLDLCVADGAGTSLDAINISDGLPVGDGSGLFDEGIQLVDGANGSIPAGVRGGVVNDTGANVAVITYTLQLATSATPGSIITNTASLLDFTNSPSASSHLGSPLTATATVTVVDPSAAKAYTADTEPATTLPNVTIGEVVTYQVTLTVPEGTVPAAQLRDTLPVGLGFVDCVSIDASAAVATSLGADFSSACAAPAINGQDVTFGLGDLTNSDSDNGTPETIVLTYRVVVQDIAANVRGHGLQNGAVLSWTGHALTAARATSLNVLEPILTIAKTANPASGDASDTITYAVTISNPTNANGSTAFDAVWTDSIPAGLTYVPGSLEVFSGPAWTSHDDGSAPDLTASWDSLAQNATIVLHYQATLDTTVPSGAVYTNTATVTWTSLPGADAGERTGDDGSAGSPDNYARTATATVTVVDPSAAKAYTADTEPATTLPNVTIGEVVTYQVTLTVPEGTVPAAQLRDTLPVGLGFVDCVSIDASAAVATSLGADFSSACAAPAINGQDVTFGLGDLTNSDSDNGTPETIVLTYRVVVQDIAANVRGHGLQNGAVLSWTGHALTAARATSLNVLEPILTIAKTANPASGDASDTITYAVTISNPTNANGSTAFDAVWTDSIPAGLTYVPGSLEVFSGPAWTSHDDGSAPDLTASWDSLAQNATIVLHYQATLDTTVPSGAVYTNTATVTWTSLPGADAGERTGDDGSAGSPDNYARTATATVTVTQPAPVKTLVTTSETDTLTTHVAIGEVVRFRVVVTIPEGTTPSVTLTDLIPSGLTFLNDATATAALVSNGGGAGLTSTTLSGPGLAVTGDGTWAGHPTYVIPDPDITPAGSYADGADPTFNLGSLTNDDSDADTEIAVVEFNAIVSNVAGNTSGKSLADTIAMYKNGVLLQTSASLAVTVAHPSITVFSKALTTTPVDGGDQIVYRITVTNGAGANISPAYEYRVLDTVDANVTVTGITVGGTAAYTDNTAGNAVDVTFTSVPASTTYTIDITGTVSDVVEAGKAISNQATSTWTSLPGANGTVGGTNTTGSNCPGASGTSTGERSGGSAPNNYTGTTGVVTATMAAPSISKLGPTPATAVIGGDTTFDLVVALPEGTSKSLVVIDTLPSGLIPVSYAVVTEAASSGGRLGSDFNGTVTATPTESTRPAGSAGGAWTLTFGDTVATADNVGANNSFLVQITAKAANVVANQSNGTLINSASLKYTQATVKTVNAPATRFVTIKEPVLQIVKNANVTSPGFGAVVTYTLTVSHAVASNATACDVVLSDTLPAGLTYVASSLLNTGGQAPDDTIVVGDTITISFDAFAGGATSTYTYQAQVGNSSEVDLKDTLTNNARVTWTSISGGDANERTGADGPGGALNDYAAATTAPVTVSGTDLTITNSDGETESTAGVVRTYVLGYENVGNATATGSTITETVPAGTTFNAPASTAGWSCSDGAVAGTVCTHLAGTGSVAAGASGNVSFAVTVVDPIPEGMTEIEDTATIADDHAINPDPTPANNVATDTDTIPQADLSLTKTVDDSTPDAGQVVVFTFTVSNAGPDDATTVKVTDALPATLTYVTSSPNAGGSYNPATHIWTVGTVASGGSQSMTLSALVAGSATATNVAEVGHADQGDVDSTPANGVDTEDDYATATVSPNIADLGVTKAVDETHPDVGTDVTYTIVASNAGPNDADGVEVTDALPAGLTYQSSDATAGSYDSGTHIWTIGTLANGTTETLTIVATVANPGTLTNSASIAGDPFDPNAANNNASATTSQLVDLVVTKSVDDQTANVGEDVTFTIGVTNSGPDIANGVVIRDLLPAGLTYVSNTPDAGTSYNSTTGDWTVGTLAAGLSATLTLEATVVGASASTNTAAVLAADEPQSSTANDSATATVTPPHAELGITKSAASQRPNVGDPDSFTLTVTNYGPDDATGVTVADLLPAGLDYVSHLAGQGGYDDSTGIWSIGNLANGASVTLTIDVDVPSAGDYTNTATVTGDQFDPDLSNNTDQVSVSTRIADIAVLKVVDHPSPNVGSIVTFTITVTNLGPDAATLLVVHDGLPAGLSYDSSTPSAGAYNSTTGDWTIGGLADGATVTLDISARVTGSGSIGNIAAVGGLLQRDPDDTNDSSTATIDAPPAADLEVSKTVDDDTPDLGSTVTFTITLTNHGPDATAGVHVRDLLPAGLTYVSDTPSKGAYDQPSGDWTVGGMAVGASETLTVTAAVDVEGPITNIAEVTDSSLPDPNSTPDNNSAGENDQAAAILNARGVADISLAKTVTPGSVQKDDQATYTIVVTNNGPDAASGVIVRDQLPAAVTFVSSSGGTYDAVTGAWTVGNMASGTSATLTITVRVSQAGSIANTASVVASNQRDPNDANGEATAGIVAAGPTLPPTGTNDSGRVPLDLGQVAVWLFGFTLAAFAVLASTALATRNRRFGTRR